MGMGPGPIPWTAKREYAAHYGLDGQQCETFFSIMDKLDFDYLKSVQKPKTPTNGRLKRTG